MNPENFKQFCDHAQAQHPKEACGLLVSVNGKEVYWPATNQSESPDDQFVISPRDFLDASKAGRVLAVCHSHPDDAAIFSDADRSSCEVSGLPWYVINCPGFGMDRIEPCGFKAPLVGREFVHGVHDCFGLIRDYYAENLGVELHNFARTDKWWESGLESLYLDNYIKAGFQKVDTLKDHDVILMQLRSTVPNHAGVYIGDGVLLQHVFGHLSHRTVYGGFWDKHTVGFYRHESQM